MTPQKLYQTLGALSLTAALLFATGCKHDYNAQPLAANAADPAAGNLAPVNGQTTRVLDQSDAANPQQQSETYNDATYDPNATPQGQPVYEQQQAPPPLQSTDQPPAPGPNYIWTPGYWGNGPSGYVWVPGAWTQPPYTGALWTPPYWRYTNARYRFHQGYWGRHIGYYGGIDYGNGYIGTGYYGGYWQGPNFYYNREVNHIGGGIGFVYDRPVFYGGIHYGFGPHIGISFNGGPGGIAFGPRPYEYVAMREEHRGPYGVQIDNWHRAGGREDFGHFEGDRGRDFGHAGFHGDEGFHGGDRHDEGHGGGDHGDHGGGDRGHGDRH